MHHYSCPSTSLSGIPRIYRGAAIGQPWPMFAQHHASLLTDHCIFNGSVQNILASTTRACSRAALSLSLAAEGLLAVRPALQPVREASRAVVRALSGCGRRCRRAALALSLAAESLLALRPALQPVREARRAVIGARSGRRRGRRCHGRAADVVMR